MIAQRAEPGPGDERSQPTPALQRGAREARRFVALRTKTLALLTITAIGLVAALYIPLRMIVLGSFLELEARTTQTEVERARDALRTAITKIDDSTAGYATWDDTYAFVQDHNPEYLEDNLADPSFPAEDINLAMIVDDTGQIVGAKAYDLAQQRSIPVPPYFLQPDATHSALFKHTALDSSTTGLILLPEGPMLVASRPILTSDGHGPIHGALLMGRFLDDALIQRLAEATHLDVTFHHLEDPQLPASARTLTGEDSVITEHLSEQSIAGMTLLPDLDGKPVLVLRVETPRSIYAQGVTTVNYTMIALMLVALASVAASLLGLERVVLARIAKLDTQAHTIGESGDLALRMQEMGNDELARLSQSINSMLGALEHAQLTRIQAEEARAKSQEELLRAREEFSQMLVHDLKTPLTTISGYLSLLSKTNLDEDQQELVAGVNRGATNTLALVTQLLDIARLSEGRLELRLEEIEIEPLLRSCARELQPWADMEEKAIQVEVAPTFPSFTADIGLLRRMLVNLISNAIKHTPPRTAITLGAEIDSAVVQVYVHDTGPGISEDVQRRLFERFAATGDTSRVQGNTGLGLTFCKLAT
ncbi:MAG TPA: CHASE4 domain-containing protein [Roseiflexaceae bacterium]|nr:CHASE4 domain-containing protein [Roseiflexaceae bacterium]